MSGYLSKNIECDSIKCDRLCSPEAESSTLNLNGKTTYHCPKCTAELDEILGDCTDGEKAIMLVKEYRRLA